MALPRLFGAVLFLICAALPAFAEVINFDNLDASGGDISLDAISPYDGFTWRNFSVYTSTAGFPGFNNGIVSSPNAAYTAGDNLGTPIVSTITSSNPFNFVSADLGSGWYDDLSVTLDGLYNGTQEFTRTVVVSTTGAESFAFNFTHINELDFVSTVTGATSDPYGCGVAGCSQVTLDNFTYSRAQATIPEPSLFVALVIALATLFASHRLKLQSEK